MYIVLAIVVLLIVGSWWFFRHPKFGRKPRGARLVRMQQSPHYSKGQFHNIEFTPTFTKGHNMAGVMYNFFFKKHPGSKPRQPIPSVKTNLHELPEDQDLLVWFGHSSYYLQVSGIRFLVDPVFSGNASPLPGSNRSFPGSDAYSIDDLPAIDYLLITHDHYDHLDYSTITGLKNKVSRIICGLGVGEHLEYWGYDPAVITELEWNETLQLPGQLTLHTATTRHFSGRGIRRNNTMWLSFILYTPHLRLYLGGDSGYGRHFAAIGEQYGPFDLALLDNGQYNPAWRSIHMFPEDVLRAATDLKARRIMAGHSAKFAMAMHPWDEPLKRITELNQETRIPMVTPRIGEVLYLQQPDQVFDAWWSK